MSTTNLHDQVAVITGAGKGIGRHLATEFGAAGARVVVSDVDSDASDRVAASIPGGISVPCDVRDEDQVIDLIKGAVDHFGRVDVMVPNAGVGVVEPLISTDLATWRSVTSVNLDGVFLCMRYAAEAMVERGGAIVNISSVTATAGSALVGPYAAAKAGVLNSTKTAATEWRSHGIRVNAVLPGFIGTDLVTDVAADFEQHLGLEAGGFNDVIAAKQGRWGLESDVSKAVLFLADPAQSWVTGAGLTIDGGLTAALL